VDATASNGSSQCCWISVATSGTDFTAPEADFAKLIRAAEEDFGAWREELRATIVAAEVDVRPLDDDQMASKNAFAIRVKVALSR